MTQTVGKVYAEALFALAEEEHCEKAVYDDLNAAAEMFAAHPDFTALLSVPDLGAEEKITILRNVIGDEAGITENFLCLLTEKRRINRIAEICSAFNAMYYEKFSIAEVFVTTAEPLEDTQREKLTAKLSAKLSRTIRLTETVQPDILGGMIVQYGDTRMDNSLRTRMNEMSRNLASK